MTTNNTEKPLQNSLEDDGWSTASDVDTDASIKREVFSTAHVKPKPSVVRHAPVLEKYTTVVERRRLMPEDVVAIRDGYKPFQRRRVRTETHRDTQNVSTQKYSSPHSDHISIRHELYLFARSVFSWIIWGLKIPLSLILILFIGMWMVSYTSSRISASVCSTPVISILCNELQQPITLVSSSISPPDICSWPLVSNIKLCKDKQSAESKELPYKRFHEVEMGVLEVVQSKGVGKAISENMSRSASTIAELKAKLRTSDLQSKDLFIEELANVVTDSENAADCLYDWDGELEATLNSMMTRNKFTRKALEGLQHEEASLFYSVVLPNRAVRKRKELIFRFNSDTSKLKENIDTLIKSSQETRNTLQGLRNRLNGIIENAETDHGTIEKEVKALLADKKKSFGFLWESLSEKNQIKIANAKDGQELLSTLKGFCTTAADVLVGAISHLEALRRNIRGIQKQMEGVEETASSASFEEYLDVLSRGQQALLHASNFVKSGTISTAYAKGALEVHEI